MAKELRSALSHIKLSKEGVYVQASTLGSLEALLDFLKSSKIPVSVCPYDFMQSEGKLSMMIWNVIWIHDHEQITFIIDLYVYWTWIQK